MLPIDDPKQLVKYLESFYDLVRSGMSGQPYGAWVDQIRTDLSGISDLAIRQRALELFRHVESGGYVLRRNPELRETTVLPPIRELIDYLKQAFGLGNN